MSSRKTYKGVAPNVLGNPALRDAESSGSRSEEWNNFMHRVTEVSTIVSDLAGGDESRAAAAQTLADKYLGGKVLHDNLQTVVTSDRTLINPKARGGAASGEVDREAWMSEMSADAERRAQDRSVRRERADTFKTLAVRAFRRGEYDKALSCYTKAIEQTRDNPMFYCDRALTYIKLGNYEKVVPDCELALRLNEGSFKARLYKARAHQELGDEDALRAVRGELEDKFPQHLDLVKYFLDENAADNQHTDDGDDD